jgi:hypothetical protein
VLVKNILMRAFEYKRENVQWAALILILFFLLQHAVVGDGLGFSAAHVISIFRVEIMSVKGWI